MIPVEKNKEYTVTIEGISSDGSGVAHIDGFTVFVPHTADGDKARIRIENVRKRFAQAVLQEVIAPSYKRCADDCVYYGDCGGCCLRHIEYGEQLEIKKSVVENAMSRIGGFDGFRVDEIIGMEKPSRYRNKMVFPVGNDGQKSISGFYAPHSHDVIPMGDCKIGDELNNEIIRAVTEFMDEEKVSAYDEKSHTGVIRRIFTRKSFCDNEMMVVICANTDKLPSGDKLIQRLRTVSDKIVSIILNVNTQRNGAVITEKNITLWGKDRIGDSLCGVKFMISPQSFFQVNPIQAEKLYNKVLEYAAPNRNTRVLDIYCGIGTISLCAAKKAGHVTGVEIVERAIIDAKENAAANGIENAEFFAASAQTLVPRLIDGGAAPDIVILDPPRKGSDKATLSAIASAEPEKVVYVSCDCATLARDARFLADNGYKIEKAAAVDMFPHTAHIETVVLMTRGK